MEPFYESDILAIKRMTTYYRDILINAIHNQKMKKSLALFSFVLFLGLVGETCFAQNESYKFPNYPDKYAGLDESEIKLADILTTHLLEKYILIKNETEKSFSSSDWKSYGDDFFQIDNNGRVRVEIGVPELSSDYKQQLLENGFEIKYEIEKYHRYDGWLALKNTEAIAALEFVSFIRAIERPITNNTIKTHGDIVHKSDRVRREWPEITGEGIKVGIISDGVDHKDEAFAVDELPYIDVVADGSGDEGTAMLEIVYDIAPGAQLAFASHGGSEAEMAANIDALVQSGCNIICDDITFWHEPIFENGIIGTKVNEVYNNGILYVASAGNYGDKHYAGDYFNDGNNWNRFTLDTGPRNYLKITIEPEEKAVVALHWNDQFGNSGNDYDLYFYDGESNLIKKSHDTQNGDDDPYEVLGFENTSTASKTIHVKVLNVDGNAATRILNMIFYNCDLEGFANVEPSSYWGHPLVEGCISVGAIHSFLGLGIILNRFSSRGPALIYSFDIQGNPLSFIERIKPDLVAINDVETFVGQQGFFKTNPFTGTSASAPHAAANAALIWSCHTSMSNVQVRDYLEQNCDQTVINYIGLPKNNYTGEGMVNAVNSILELETPTPPIVEITNPGANELLNGTVNISIDASDNSANADDDGIDSVRIYINNALMVTQTQAPYSYSWNTLLYSNGNYEIKAVTYDIVGASSEDILNVTVLNQNNYIHDFAVTNLLLDPSLPEVGQQVNITASVVNVGSETELSGQYVRLYVNGVQNDYELTDELEPGESFSAAFTWTPDEEAGYNIKVKSFLTGDENSANDYIQIPVNIGEVGNLLVNGSSAPSGDYTFTSDGGSGNYSLTLENTAFSPIIGSISKSGNVAGWVDLSGGGSFLLPGFGYNNYSFGINVPSGTALGDYNAIIKFSYSGTFVDVVLNIHVVSSSGGVSYNQILESGTTIIDGTNDHVYEHDRTNQILDNDPGTPHDNQDIITMNINPDYYNRINDATWLIDATELGGTGGVNMKVVENPGHYQHEYNTFIEEYDVMEWITLDASNQNNFRIKLSSTSQYENWSVNLSKVRLYVSNAAWAKNWQISQSLLDSWAGGYDYIRLYFHVDDVNDEGTLQLYNNGEEISTVYISSSHIGDTEYFSISLSKLSTSNYFNIKGKRSNTPKVTISNIGLEVEPLTGDPFLICTKSLDPGEATINQNITVNMSFTNTGTNIADEPTYNDNPLPEGLILIDGTLSDDASNVDPGDTETASYVISPTTLGNFTFGGTVVNYYNPSGDLFQTTFNPVTLSVSGGILLIAAEVTPDSIEIYEAFTISTTVMGSAMNNVVEDACVECTVTKPDNTQSSFNLIFDGSSQQYIGTFDQTSLEGDYVIGITAQRGFYEQGTLAPNMEVNAINPAEPPTVQNTTYSFINNTELEVSSQINPNGYETTYQIHWGLTSDYGNATPLQNIGNGISSLPINENIGGLLEGESYHMQLIAQNQGGTGFSPDITIEPIGEPHLNVTPTTQSFGATIIYECSNAQTFELINDGESPAEGVIPLQSDSPLPDFIVTNISTGSNIFSLQPGESLSFDVEFCPEEPIYNYATELTIDGAEPCNDVVVQLSGNVLYNVELVIDVMPPEAGTVSGEGFYVSGTEVTISAFENMGWVFLNWTESGEVISTDSVYSFEAFEDHYLTSNFQGLDSVDVLILKNGWNLISFDVILNENTPDDVFSDLISSSTLDYVTSYGETNGIKNTTHGSPPLNLPDDVLSDLNSVSPLDGVSSSGMNAGLYFNPNGMSIFNTLTEIVPHQGYWVKVNSDCNFTVEGIPITGQNTCYNLLENWNLISYWPGENMPPETAFTNLISQDQLVIIIGYENGVDVFFNPNTPQLNTLTELRNGHGYWVQTTENIPCYSYPQTEWLCGDSIVDQRDGQSYGTVLIGNQCWFKENLNYESGNSWCYDNNPVNCDNYGRLYDWETALIVCPNGWHLPSDEEWKMLEGEVDSQYNYPDPEWDGQGMRGFDAGLNLKSTSGWNSNGNGTDLYGFGALPGGDHGSSGSFGLGSSGRWWSSSETLGTIAWGRHLYNYDDGSSRYNYFTSSGLSVRCLKDTIIQNLPPNTPSNPSPSNDTIIQTTSAVLEWDCTDPEGDPLLFDIYFGNETDPPLLVSSHTESSYDPGVLENNTYYWKIVAHDDKGNTTEGPEWSFSTPEGGGSGEPCPGTETVTYGGQVYNTVLIGNQCWFKENLNIGTMIPGDDDMLNNSTIEKYCYDDAQANCDTYGGLYQWNEMMQYTTQQGIQGICPLNWHIPTDEEWKELEGEVDSQYGYPNPEWDDTGWRGLDAGLILKSTSGWNSNGNGTDLYGFGALPGGYRDSNGSFYVLGNFGYWWSSSEGSGTSAWYRGLYYDFDGSYRYNYYKSLGFSVRCLKDN